MTASFLSFSLKSLQLIQNAAARVLMITNRRDHISPVLASLHWLPVKFRIEFKILLLTYKALNDQATSYLKGLIVGYFPNRALCSQTAGLLVASRVCLFQGIWEADTLSTLLGFIRLGLKLSFLIKLIVRDGSGDPETSHS